MYIKILLAQSKSFNGVLLQFIFYVISYIISYHVILYNVIIVFLFCIIYIRVALRNRSLIMGYGGGLKNGRGQLKFYPSKRGEGRKF